MKNKIILTQTCFQNRGIKNKFEIDYMIIGSILLGLSFLEGF